MLGFEGSMARVGYSVIIHTVCVDGTPASSPIGALKYTAISPCIDGARVFGIDGQGKDSGTGHASVAGTPVISAIGALKYPAISPCIDGLGA